MTTLTIPTELAHFQLPNAVQTRLQTLAERSMSAFLRSKLETDPNPTPTDSP